MRKIGICALGVLALGFEYREPPVNQDRQEGPQQGAPPDRFVWKTGFITGQDVAARVEAVRRVDQPRAIVADESGQILWVGDESEPLMQGDLESAVEEMELVSQRMRNGTPEKRLAALDDAERAVMRARKSLGPRGAPRAGIPDEDPDLFHEVIPTSGSGTIRYWSLNGMKMLYRAPHQRADLPTYSEYAWAITLVRQAPEADSARAALDEVERSIHGLRALFWEQEAEKG